MSIIRTKKTNHYVCIDNSTLEDNTLSLKAKGLLAYLLTKPDSWGISVNHLVKHSTDGKAAIYSAIKELGNAGYITKYQKRLPDGRLSELEYVIHEHPNPPLTDNQEAGSPLTDLPHTDNRYTDNRTLVSTDIVSTDNQQSLSIDIGKERFEDFWVTYPKDRRKYKFQCRKVWQKKKLDGIADKIIADVLNRIENDDQWKDGFHPGAKKYLENECWEEDICVRKKKIQDVDRIRQNLANKINGFNVLENNVD